MPFPAEARDRLHEWRYSIARIYLTGVSLIVPFVLLIMVAGPPPRFNGPFWFVAITWGGFLAARFLAPPRVQAVIVVGLLMVAAAVGPLFLGLSPGPFLAGASGALLAAVVFGRRAALVMLAVLAVSLLGSGALISSGTLNLHNRAATDPLVVANWVRLTLFTGLNVGLLLVVVTELFERMAAAWRDTAEAAERERNEAAQRRVAEQRAFEAQRLESIGRLAGGVAHDFNNLLVVILGWADLLPQSKSEDERNEGLEAIRTASLQAAQLTRQLLSFARRTVVQPTAVDLDAFLASTLKSVRRMLADDIRIDHVRVTLPRALADETQLGQVILNLVVNASDAMPKGGTITARAALLEPPALPAQAPDPKGRYVAVVVEDTGMGMDEATLARIFEPFFTTKGPGKGTGLGLASVYGIASQSNGFVDVWSRADEGSRFTVAFPVASGDAPRAGALPGAAPATVVARVLLVEDDGQVRATMARALRRAGMDLTEAGDVEQALAALRDRTAPFDLLCTDAVMPGLPTQDLITEFRRVFPEAPVLVCSGYVGEELVRRGIEERSVALLPKPFTGEALADKVRALLPKKA
ncbi:MAG: response regulator [Deltaproteobacteria bacterium]|nr:response regulator [Deltaproteobacteria bacterium]